MARKPSHPLSSQEKQEPINGLKKQTEGVCPIRACAGVPNRKCGLYAAAGCGTDHLGPRWRQRLDRPPIPDAHSILKKHAKSAFCNAGSHFLICLSPHEPYSSWYTTPKSSLGRPLGKGGTARIRNATRSCGDTCGVRSTALMDIDLTYLRMPSHGMGWVELSNLGIVHIGPIVRH